MVFAADYPLMDVFWSICIFFLWVMWFWMLVSILSDVFRRSDLSGWGKAGWTLFLFVMPLFSALIYLGTNRGAMVARAERDSRRYSSYSDVAAMNGGTPAAEIEKAKGLLDSGIINQGEFDAIKAKALAVA